MAAPLAAVCLRLTLALTITPSTRTWVRTGIAKGLTHARVVRRHAGAAAFPAIASLVGISVPAVVTYMVLVEWVFALPGFFRHTKRALGQAVPPTIDIPPLQALALWAAVLM